MQMVTKVRASKRNKKPQTMYVNQVCGMLIENEEERIEMEEGHTDSEVIIETSTEDEERSTDEVREMEEISEQSTDGTWEKAEASSTEDISMEIDEFTPEVSLDHEEEEEDVNDEAVSIIQTRYGYARAESKGRDSCAMHSYTRRLMARTVAVTVCGSDSGTAPENKDEDDEEHEVQELLDKVTNNDGTCYKVRWVDGGPDSDCWINKEDLGPGGCTEMMDEYSGKGG